MSSGTFGLGETAHFRYFDVTVHERRSQDNGVEGGGIHGARVTVCYTHPHPGANADGTARTSTNPWTLGWVHGPDPVWSLDAQALSSAWHPVYTERLLRPGQCNTGWIAIDIQETAYASHIGMRYAPADFDFGGTWRW